MLQSILLLVSEQSERDIYRGVHMEIIDYSMYINGTQASVCMSFEAQTSVHVSYKLGREPK